MGFESGQVVGRYQLIEKLGFGATAEVWKAIETSEVGFNKEVALKIVREEDLHPDELDDSLLKEAQLCANLRHPNIVDILGVEESDGAIQVAMEFVDGGTLAGLIAKVRSTELLIPHSVILDIGIGLCRALHRAHTFSDAEGEVRPIIHRDLKPANILMSRAGVPKIADFGLAKASGEKTETVTGILKGTPAYLAPELWEGGRDFKPGVDLFAVGCILWELVQLKRLFGPGLSLPQIYLLVSRRDPAEEAAECLGRFEALVPTIEKLIQRDPKKRYKRASVVINDLQVLRKDSMASGEIGDFMELMSLTELPTDQRKLPHSSQFRIPETTDPVWRAVISEALGEDVPVDPSFSDLPGEFRGGAASGGHRMPNTSPSATESAAEGSSSYRRSGAAEEGTVVVSRSHTMAAAKRMAVEESVAPARQSSYRIGGALLLAVGLALAWFSLGSGGKQNLASDAADSVSSVTGPDAAAELKSVAGSAVNPGDDEAMEPHPPTAEGAVGEATRSPGPPVAASVPSEATPTRSPILGKAELKVKPKQDMKPTPKPEPTSVDPPKRSVGGGPSPPTAAGDKGCLLLTGSPGGLVVWLDGSKQGRRAGRSEMKIRRRAGAVTVGMGMSDSPSVAVTTSLQSGGATVVHCDLLVSQSCTARAADPKICR